MGQDNSRKVALVTGASYGVGAATALALARDGFALALTATRKQNLAATLADASKLGDKRSRSNWTCARKLASRRW